MLFYPLLRAIMVGRFAHFSGVLNRHSTHLVQRCFIVADTVISELPDDLDGVVSCARYECISESVTLERHGMQCWTHDEIVQVHDRHRATVRNEMRWSKECYAIHSYVLHSVNGRAKRTGSHWKIEYDGPYFTKQLVKKAIIERELRTFRGFHDAQ